MIQRIQTVYLLILFLINVIGVFINNSVFASIDKGFSKFNVLTLDVLFISIAVISIILSLITILNYKKRVLQMWLCQFIIFFNLLFIIITGVFVYQQISLSGELDYPEKGIEWVTTLFSILLAILAKRGVKNDDELVKSADRFR
mgnify:CR=1 FL=1